MGGYFKYLGIKINSKLKCNEHIAEVTTNASRVLNLLRQTMYGCSKKTKTRAYAALVRPHLEYCAPVWNPYQQKDCEALETVQRRAARWL